MTIMEERMAEVAARAAAVFGWNVASTLSWLKSPEPALGGAIPSGLLATDYGYSRVLQVLADMSRVTSIAA